ncbi:integrin alpha [Streptomyces sp. TRM72054]|uniref:integrin alpha n=1 Tax=Streptomyces sp. TRM72054 TaxID=2870562 RepID=UPI001C8CA5F2|nr:integrin alpha [Streptomyces sp. TRM72054]MBX9396424.1 integrin alpha [Streptomyces sp. TRM72054]
MRTRMLLTSAVLLASGLTPLVAGGAQAVAGTPGDINKDGYRDVVVSAPDAKVGGHAKAGAVVILYGTARGIDPARRTVLTQNSTGIPDKVEPGDRFGAAVVVHDLNADGYSDLVVGSPGEEVGGDVGGGSVTVIWGGSSGPTKAKIVADPSPSSHDAYGRTLAVGTYNSLNPVNDGKLSIAIGANDGEVTFMPANLSAQSGTSGVGTDFNPGHGIVALTAVDVPNTDDDQLVIHGRGVSDGGWGYDGYGDDPGTRLISPGGFETYTVPRGTVSAVGNLDGNGSPDLVVGNPEDPAQSPETSLGGRVTVYYDAAYGGSPSRVQTIDQDTPGVPSSGEKGDRFGASVAIGDTDKDGRADLVIGAPGEDSAIGAVTVVRGTTSLLDTARARIWTQNVAGVPGSSEKGDGFGTAVRIVDTNKDGYGDLLIGAAGEDGGAGCLWYLRGSAASVTATGAVSVGAGGTGLGSAGAARFGWLVTGP